MQAIYAAPKEQQSDCADAQDARPCGRSRQPLPRRPESFSFLCCGGCFFIGAAQQQSGNSRVAQLPQRTIQNKVMNIDQRCEREETGCEIQMEQSADDPRPGDEKRDAASDERQLISQEAPGRLSGRGCFFFLIVAGDPEILRGVQYR